MNWIQHLKLRFVWLLAMLFTIGTLSGCGDLSVQPASGDQGGQIAQSSEIDEQGTYHTKEDVALYIHTYGRLPENFITKKEAEKLGWKSSEGNLSEVAPGKSIGGSRFGNYEGQLPDAADRKYYECDINYGGGYRGPERIVYSNDGLIYYTDDHYKTFELLYGNPGES